MFWKGSGNIVKIYYDSSSANVIDITCWTSVDIIFEIIKIRNPKILEDLEMNLKKKIEWGVNNAIK